MILSNGITLRCSQPWFVGVLGGPVVPAHQPRQIIDGNQTQRPTVSTSWNRGFAVRPQSKRATGVLCVEENNSNNLFLVTSYFCKLCFGSGWNLEMIPNSIRKMLTTWREEMLQTFDWSENISWHRCVCAEESVYFSTNHKLFLPSVFCMLAICCVCHQSVWRNS